MICDKYRHDKQEEIDKIIDRFSYSKINERHMKKLQFKKTLDAAPTTA